MSDDLCQVPDCYIPNQHATDCQGGPDQPCTGCLPGLALDGLRICAHHRRQGIRDLARLPALDADLGITLATRRRPVSVGYVQVSGDGTGLDLDQDVMDARDYIRGRLFTFIALITVERGIHPPTEQTTKAMCVFIARHSDWLSAHKHAGPRWVTTIGNVAKEARYRAYRGRPTGMFLGTCPQEGEDGPCGAPVRHDPSDYAGDGVTCRQCGTTGTVEWWQSQLLGGEAADHLPAAPLAALLSSRYNHPIGSSTIRAWASKGLIGRGEKDTKGRTLYDVAEVRAHADTVWPVATRRTA